MTETKMNETETKKCLYLQWACGNGNCKPYTHTIECPKGGFSVVKEGDEPIRQTFGKSFEAMKGKIFHYHESVKDRFKYTNYYTHKDFTPTTSQSSLPCPAGDLNLLLSEHNWALCETCNMVYCWTCFNTDKHKSPNQSCAKLPDNNGFDDFPSIFSQLINDDPHFSELPSSIKFNHYIDGLDKSPLPLPVKFQETVRKAMNPSEFKEAVITANFKVKLIEDPFTYHFEPVEYTLKMSAPLVATPPIVESKDKKEVPLAPMPIPPPPIIESKDGKAEKVEPLSLPLPEPATETLKRKSTLIETKEEASQEKKQKLPDEVIAPTRNFYIRVGETKLKAEFIVKDPKCQALTKMRDKPSDPMPICHVNPTCSCTKFDTTGGEPVSYKPPNTIPLVPDSKVKAFVAKKKGCTGIRLCCLYCDQAGKKDNIINCDVDFNLKLAEQDQTADRYCFQVTETKLAELFDLVSTDREGYWKFRVLADYLEYYSNKEENSNYLALSMMADSIVVDLSKGLPIGTNPKLPIHRQLMVLTGKFFRWTKCKRSHPVIMPIECCVPCKVCTPKV